MSLTEEIEAAMDKAESDEDRLKVATFLLGKAEAERLDAVQYVVTRLGLEELKA